LEPADYDYSGAGNNSEHYHNYDSYYHHDSADYSVT
jgi:hypothetical protein